MQAVRRIVRGGKLALGGLHTHIGTFILETAAYGRAAVKLADFATEIEKELGVKPRHLDLGGGFASNNTLSTQYHAGAIVPSVSEYADAISTALLDSDLDGPVNVGSAEPVSIADLAGRIARQIGRPDLLR